jgi:hypothetical protein
MEMAPPPAVEVAAMELPPAVAAEVMAMELPPAVTAREVMVMELPPVEEETVKVARSEAMVVVMASRLQRRLRRLSMSRFPRVPKPAPESFPHLLSKASSASIRRTCSRSTRCHSHR